MKECGKKYHFRFCLTIFLTARPNNLTQSFGYFEIRCLRLLFVLKKKLKWKVFKIAVGQELTSDHKKQRREFCQWLLDQPEDLPQKIIFGDEKWFILKKEANRQNTQHWAAINSFECRSGKAQGGKKLWLLWQWSIFIKLIGLC